MISSAGDDDRTELARSLLSLRKDAGLTQPEVIIRAELHLPRSERLSQAQLSRIERGRAIPTERQVAMLADLYGAAPHRMRQLLALRDDQQAGVTDRRLVVQRGNTLAIQQRWRRLERDTSMIRSYNPALVLGVLQTPAYASVVFGEPADSDVVRDRMLRQEHLLSETERQHVLIQTEGALTWQVGSPAVMDEQVDAIVAASRRPNVQLGIIPGYQPVDFTAGTAFHIYDDRTVVVGLEIAAASLNDAADRAHFRTLFERLQTAAVFGEEARGELRRIAVGFRARSGKT